MAQEGETRPERLLEGKVAIVTGGASGIGKAIAKEFLQEGAKVAILDIKSSKTVKDFLRRADLLYLQVDITSEKAVASAIGNITKRFGPVTTLVNNAGISHSAEADQYNLEDWRRVIDTDLVGQFIVTQNVTHRMKELQIKGSIVFITSIHDQVALEHQKVTAYDAAKAGLRGLATSLAVELGPFGIRVNAIAPGAIDPTGISHLAPLQRERFAKSIPLRRIGAPEDIAPLAAFLASDKAGYLSGARIPVDGGSTALSSLREVD